MCSAVVGNLNSTKHADCSVSTENAKEGCLLSIVFVQRQFGRIGVSFIDFR